MDEKILPAVSLYCDSGTPPLSEYTYQCCSPLAYRERPQPYIEEIHPVPTKLDTFQSMYDQLMLGADNRHLKKNSLSGAVGIVLIESSLLALSSDSKQASLHWGNTSK